MRGGITGCGLKFQTRAPGCARRSGWDNRLAEKASRDLCRHADLLNQYLPFIPCLSLFEPGKIGRAGGRLITIGKLQAWKMSIQFEWDEEKASGNEKKHGVTFEEARTIFNDPFAITIADPAHSAHEDRWLDIGFSSQGQVTGSVVR